jgi:CRP-like cAMP-binding protein
VIPQLIDQIPLFLRLSDEERELISSRLRHLEFNSNDVVFSANKPPEMFGAIIQGWVKLEGESPQGKIALANLGAGSVIGEVDLLLNRPYSTTARAASPTSIHALYRQDLQDLILECPTIGLKFSYGLGTRVAYLDEYLVTQRLGALPLLSSLAEQEMRAIARKLQFRSFQRGDAIFEAGDAADAVYLIEEGTVRLVTTSRDGESFDEVKEGEILGQTGLVTGKASLATARAVTDLSVWVLTRAEYQELIREHPSIKIAFSRALAEGLSSDDQAKAAELLRSLALFADVDSEALGDLTGRLVLRHFPAGELIYAQGTPGDAMYFIEAGEVQLDPESTAQTGSHERKRPGQSFGEMALLTGRTRAEVAKAIDDATVWVLYKSDYDDLIVRHPALSLALSRALSGKLSASQGEYVERHLPQLKLLNGLSPTELREVIEHVKPKRFRPNETICFAGQQAQHVYLIESGEVRELAGGPNGQAVVLNLHGADQSFGERAVFQGSAYGTTMQAVGPVSCLAIPKVDFDRLIARYPALALNVARMMAEDAQHAAQRVNSNAPAVPTRANGSGRYPAQPPQPPQDSTDGATLRRPNPPLGRAPMGSRGPASTRTAPGAQFLPAVGVRTKPGKPWERNSNRVMRPMPAATARPIAVNSVMAQSARQSMVRPLFSQYGEENIIARLGALSASTKLKMAIVAFFAFWLLVVLPLGLIFAWASSANFMGNSTGSPPPSQQLPANLNLKSPKILSMFPGGGKLAVLEPTETPIPPPPTRKPTAQPTARPTRKPLVLVKAKQAPSSASAEATPTAVAQAMAVIPPLPPRIWDQRLGAGGLPLLTGVGVTDASVQSGQQFWRLTKMIFQDAGAESGNDHTIYISIVDENGQRLNDQSVKISWDDAGQVQVQRLGLPDQKPKGDYCNCNYNWPMYGAGYRAKVDGSLPSDEAYGMIMPEHRHVNYLLTFQRVVMP